MDTKDKYLDTELAVQLADGRCKGREDRSYNVPDRGLGGIKDHRRGAGGEKIPVDGWVTFYWPDRPEDEPHIGPFFPFRDERKGDRWFGRPDDDDFSRRPIWKWENPEQHISQLTLNPSLGVRGDGELTFHCWIEGGSVSWI